MRNKTMAWFILALYLSASIRLVLPPVQDLLEHTLFWAHHLAHVHHGHEHSDHVAHELHHAYDSADDTANDRHKPLSITFLKNILSVHLFPDLIIQIPSFYNGYSRLKVVADVISPYSNWQAKIPVPPPWL